MELFDSSRKLLTSQVRVVLTYESDVRVPVRKAPAGRNC